MEVEGRSAAYDYVVYGNRTWVAIRFSVFSVCNHYIHLWLSSSSILARSTVCQMSLDSLSPSAHAPPYSHHSHRDTQMLNFSARAAMSDSSADTKGDDGGAIVVGVT